MKLICDGLDLSDAVLKVSKALSVKAANPILEGIKITAKGDRLTLLATDTEIAIEKTIRAEILEEGEALVQGKLFNELVKKLEEEQRRIEEMKKREARKDRLHQNYLKRKANGKQQEYYERTKAKKKAEMDAKKEEIRQEDIAKGVFIPVSLLPPAEPKKGVASA